MISLLIVYNLAQAQMRSNLFTKPEEPIKVELAQEAPKKKKSKAIPSSGVGNLPLYFANRGSFQAEESPVVLPTSRAGILLGSIKLGDVLSAEVKESLIAFNEAKAPIRAVVTEGRQKGAILLGEATLEKNSKRILIEFKRLRAKDSNQSYNLLAYGIDLKGILGIEGKVISGEDKYFTAEVIATAASSYADATISREQNNLGNYVEKPGADTLGKKALSSALSKTAERFAEKLKIVPEYSVLEGPTMIQVLITENPKLIE